MDMQAVIDPANTASLQTQAEQPGAECRLSGR